MADDIVNKEYPIDKNLFLEFVKSVYAGYVANGKPERVAEALTYGLGITKAFQSFSAGVCNIPYTFYSLVEGENPKRRVRVEFGKCEFCPFCAYAPGTQEHPNMGLCSVFTKDVEDINEIPEWCPIFNSLQDCK